MPPVKRGFLLVLLALFLVDGVIGYWWWQRHKERRYDQQIREAAQRYDVSPALVKAVVWQESRFNAEARGLAGEIGLMQIRSLAAQEWADAERLKVFAHENIISPTTNTLVGTWYLGKLLKRYRATDNPVAYALADYNAGRGNVLRWNKGEAATNSTAFLEQMTFPGTRRYIASVIERRAHYEPEFREAQPAAKP